MVCFTESPAVYFASVNAKLLSLSDTPIFSFVSNMRRRICLNLMFRASAFFFKSWCPFFAPPSRFLMTASTVTVGTTTYLFPAPLIANYETKPNQVLAATPGPCSCPPPLLPNPPRQPQHVLTLHRVWLCAQPQPGAALSAEEQRALDARLWQAAKGGEQFAIRKFFI